tara:strand:- start:12030 stop:12332 length:303 start_codon:yes stop_codon:yes gene_type:complete
MTKISFKSFTRKSKVTTLKIDNAESYVEFAAGGGGKFIQDELSTTLEVEALAVLLGGYNAARHATEGFRFKSSMTVVELDALKGRFDALIKDTISAMEGN